MPNDPSDPWKTNSGDVSSLDTPQWVPDHAEEQTAADEGVASFRSEWRVQSTIRLEYQGSPSDQENVAYIESLAIPLIAEVDSGDQARWQAEYGAVEPDILEYLTGVEGFRPYPRELRPPEDNPFTNPELLHTELARELRPAAEAQGAKPPTAQRPDRGGQLDLAGQAHARAFESIQLFLAASDVPHKSLLLTELTLLPLPEFGSPPKGWINITSSLASGGPIVVLAGSLVHEDKPVLAVLTGATGVLIWFAHPMASTVRDYLNRAIEERLDGKKSRAKN